MLRVHHPIWRRFLSSCLICRTGSSSVTSRVWRWVGKGALSCPWEPRGLERGLPCAPRNAAFGASVMPRIHDPQRPLGSRVRCKSKEPLFELARAQSPTCTDTAVRYQGKRVSKGQRFYWGLGAVGEVMAMASADWLGKGPGEGSESC